MTTLTQTDPQTPATQPTAFQPGQRYYRRSFCDHTVVWSFEVIRRTAQTVWLREVDHATGELEGKVHQCRVSSWEGSETCRPEDYHLSARSLVRA